jgi:hypothetical protein
MQIRPSTLGTFGTAACVIGVALGTGGPDARQPQAQLALQRLQADFHGQGAVADYDLLHSLWAEDAVAYVAGMEIHGPDAISDFFSSSPLWGHVASLAPTYKTFWDIQGNTASIQFECVLVYTGDLDPLGTSFSTIPFGGQNPDVEIVQHSTAAVEAVIENGQWKIQTFVGSAGPF